MTNTIFQKKDEKDFDEMVGMLKEMPKEEQEKLKQVFHGILIGASLAKKNNENKPVA